MKQKKIPLRMCVGCREMKPKKELLRFVCSPEGTVKMDLTSKAPGRGVYICPQKSCFERAVKTKALERALEHKLDDVLISQLKEELPDNE